MNFDTSVLQIPIEDIIPNRLQPRLAFNDTGLEELCASIKQHGIIQPLVLRPNGEKYEIIAGERRYKAAMMAGLPSVPAVIARISDKTSAEASIAENIQRKQLTAIEEARSYKALLEKGYMSQEELARRMGISQGAVSNKLRLLNLTDEVQTAVLENKISERHARSLLKVKDRNEQIEWLNKIIKERLTVRQLDEQLNAKYTDIPEENLTIKLNIENQKNEKQYFADESVNMGLFDSNEPTDFNNTEMFKLAPQVPQSTQTNDPELFDFLPPNLEKDINTYLSQIEGLVSHISQKITLEMAKNETSQEIIYTIKIKK